jgi:hypothetical protein
MVNKIENPHKDRPKLLQLLMGFYQFISFLCVWSTQLENIIWEDTIYNNN